MPVGLHQQVYVKPPALLSPLSALPDIAAELSLGDGPQGHLDAGESPLCGFHLSSLS